ncbi:MAG: hypothetical protein BMS9Abin29_0365 [Gemmatimonadota bacterium]|nr:MAG: hypothetical protein BMS9Abin29_0365 [Gemmatimonadota bacterium]
MNPTNIGRGRTRRRAVALGLMLALGMSALEALAGPVRDGSVHHESNVEASSHRSAARLAHDHADAQESASLAEAASACRPEIAPPADNTDHQHPGGEDHCAHVHGVALIPTVALMFSAIVIDAPMAIFERHDDPSGTSLPYPPRA